MYKEFKESERIDYADIEKDGVKSPIFEKKFIFAYDENGTQDLKVYIRHINEEFTVDSYEFVDDRFTLVGKGKQFYVPSEILGTFRELSSWTYSTYSDGKNYV